MRYFLDMNIPIYFCMQFGDPLEKKAKIFIQNKNNHIYLLCSYIASRNLPRWLKRQSVILFEFNQKAQNKNYTLFSSEQSSFLFPKDKIFVNKLILNYNNYKDKDEFVENVNDILNLLQSRVTYFIKTYIDEVVIPESDIDPNLKSWLLNGLNNNESDARTIASAIQEHNHHELIIITSDKKDWKKEVLETVYDDIPLGKKYPKIPEIEYLQNI